MLCIHARKGRIMFKVEMHKVRRSLVTVLSAALIISNISFPAYAAEEVSGDEGVVAAVDETVADEAGGEGAVAEGAEEDSEERTLGDGAAPGELFISDISDDDLKGLIAGPLGTGKEKGITSASITVNGFTIYDEYEYDYNYDDYTPGNYPYTYSDSQNKIKVRNHLDDYGLEKGIGVASASSAFADAYLRFGEGTPFEKSYISFETSGKSGVAVVVKKAFYSYGDSGKIYLKKESEEARVQSLPGVALGYTLDVPAAVILFDDLTAGTYYLSADEDVEIYYIKVMPKSTNKTWDFSKDDTFGTLYGKKIENTIGYIDGMLVDATEGGLERNPGSLISTFYAGTKLYVPVFENTIVYIDAARVGSIIVNGDAVSGYKNTFLNVSSEEREGYLTIGTSSDIWISTVEIDDLSKVSFNVSGKTVKSAFVDDNLRVSEADLEEADAKAAAAAPEGKMFGWWSVAENGEEFDFDSLIPMDRTFYAVYIDADEGELLFDKITEVKIFEDENTGDRYLKKAATRINGFTICDNYDYSDSQNKIKIQRISNVPSEKTCVASASKAAVDVFAIFQDVVPFTGTYISFATSGEADVAVVAKPIKRYSSDTAEKKVYLKKEGGPVYEEVIPAPFGESALMVFKADAAGTYQLSTDYQSRIYYVRVIPKNERGLWDFTKGETFGSLEDKKIEGITGYIDGMIVDATEGKLAYEDKRTLFAAGTSLHVPVSDNSVLRVAAAPGQNKGIKINGAGYGTGDEIVVKCASGTVRPGYMTLSTEADSFINKVELGHIAEFNASGKTVKSVFVGNGSRITSAQLAAAKAAAEAVAPAGKVLDYWSASQEGDSPVDPGSGVLRNNTTFYAVYKDAPKSAVITLPVQENFTVTAEAEGKTVIDNKVTVPIGNVVKLLITPDEGYEIKDHDIVSENGIPFEAASTSEKDGVITQSFNMPGYDLFVSASAKKKQAGPDDKKDQDEKNDSKSRLREAAALTDKLSEALGKGKAGEGIFSVYQSEYDGATTQVTVVKGKEKSVAVDLAALKEGENRLTFNTGVKLTLTGGEFTVSDCSLPSDKDKAKAKKLLKTNKKTKAQILNLKSFKSAKGGSYQLTLVSGAKTLLIDVVDVSLNKKGFKSVVLDKGVSENSVSNNAVSEAEIDDRGFAKDKDGAVVTIATAPVLKKEISSEEKESARFLSGTWFIGKKAITDRETQVVSLNKKGTAQVIVKYNLDGSLSIAKAEGSRKGSVNLVYILNGKTYKAKLKVQ